MPVYLIYGKLGAGKGVLTAQRIIDYLAKGSRVVTNFPVSTGHLIGFKKVRSRHIEVITDRPKAAELWALGKGGETEEGAGLLVLDECSAFLNARKWQGEERDKLLDWFIHARKLKWDVILVSQAPSQLDKQVREAIVEYYVFVRRLDRLKKFGVRLPRIHFGIVRYGPGVHDPVADKWYTRGGPECWKLYDTEWISREDCDYAWHCSIPPLHPMYVRPSPVDIYARHRASVEAIKARARAIALNPITLHTGLFASRETALLLHRSPG